MPTQVRSRARHERILVAVETLLEHQNIEDLKFSEIAQLAGISKASVHYHFPTVASVQLELGRKYDRMLSVVILDYRGRLPAMRTPMWQEWMRIEAATARDFFNAHRPACEALLGPILHRESRLAAIRDNVQVGLSKLNNLCEIFEVPNRGFLEGVFGYHGEILDSFWSASYLDNGYIDDEAFDDSVRASLGFLRNFLPDALQPAEAARRAS